MPKGTRLLIVDPMVLLREKMCVLSTRLVDKLTMQALAIIKSKTYKMSQLGFHVNSKSFSDPNHPSICIPRKKGVCSFSWLTRMDLDKSVEIGGSQTIKTIDNYMVPLTMIAGLPCLPICPYKDQEWDSLTHLNLKDDRDWNRSNLHHLPNTDVADWCSHVLLDNMQITYMGSTSIPILIRFKKLVIHSLSTPVFLCHLG